ncbi:MAG TPA: hypothetical protein PK530_01030 [Anaerolineales bacterium]|nr:hypothetical protein [Anaerolineales bacterium]
MSGAHIAAHAAAERRKQLQEEEERMTRYNSDEVNGDWEFKIVRSATEQFKKPEIFQQMVEEESLAGWQLLEKLDNNRVRFKRPVSARKRDAMLPAGVDPYRTQFGISENMLGLWVGAIILLVVGIIIFFAVMAENGQLNF